VKEQQSNLLLLSQFLRLAAARRAEEADSTLDENQALEGVLLSVYSGDESAVATMLKLINGSNENTFAVTGEKLQTTCKSEITSICDGILSHNQMLKSRLRLWHMPQQYFPPK
jgi:hypothetical protein